MTKALRMTDLHRRSDAGNLPPCKLGAIRVRDHPDEGLIAL
jgi:hypothetical protein